MTCLRLNIFTSVNSHNSDHPTSSREGLSFCGNHIYFFLFPRLLSGPHQSYITWWDLGWSLGLNIHSNIWSISVLNFTRGATRFWWHVHFSPINPVNKICNMPFPKWCPLLNENEAMAMAVITVHHCCWCEFWMKCIQKMNVSAKISYYFQCSVVILKLCKEYLNTVTHQFYSG